MLLLVNVVLCANKTTQNALCINSVAMLQTDTGSDMQFPKGCPLQVLSDYRVLFKNSWLWN